MSLKIELLEGRMHELAPESVAYSVRRRRDLPLADGGGVVSVEEDGISRVSDTRLFLRALCLGKPDHLYLSFWTLADKQSHCFRNVEEAIQFAEAQREVDLYIGVGLSGQDYGPTRRCVSTKVAGIPGMWADIDLSSDAHPNAARPNTIEDAMQILPAEFPPTFIVRTGNGIHAWWLFREPLIFETEEERQYAASLVNRWQTLLRCNAAARGWAFERLADLARLLRIPGTQNCKDPENPKPVELHSQTDRRYNPSDLVEFLDDQGVPDPVQQERATQTWNEQLADKPLCIDPSATVPAELLDRYMAADERFKNTWLRQRQDLKDESSSGYDLALANFGFKTGLSKQQVVDLIIHHRRIHGQDQRTKLDYYQRTLAKASRKDENTNLVNSLKSSIQDSDHPSSHIKPDGAMERALLCEQISNIICVRVLRIVKIDGQEPTYRLELEATKIVFNSVDKLVGQPNFRMSIASAVNHWIPKISPKGWDQLVQMILGALTVENGGDEGDLVGAAKIDIARYLHETPFIDANDEQPYQTLYRPTVYEGQIAISSRDLRQHINKTWGENRPLKEVIAMLSAVGASTIRLKRGCVRDQSRWLLPPSEFPPNVYFQAGEIEA